MLFTLVNANTHYKSTNDIALITFGGRKRSGVVNKAGFGRSCQYFHHISWTFSSSFWTFFVGHIYHISGFNSSYHYFTSLKLSSPLFPSSEVPIFSLSFGTKRSVNKSSTRFCLDKNCGSGDKSKSKANHFYHHRHLDYQFPYFLSKFPLGH